MLYEHAGGSTGSTGAPTGRIVGFDAEERADRQTGSNHSKWNLYIYA